MADEAKLLARGFLEGRGPRISIEQRHSDVHAGREQMRKRMDMATAKWVAEVLHQHYRGHFWAVTVDGTQGICLITIPILLPMSWHYKIGLDVLTPEMVIRAGGEILERYQIPRSSLDVGLGAFLDARYKFDRAKQPAG